MSGLSKALGSLVLILFTQAYLTLCSYVLPKVTGLLSHSLYY